MEFTNSFEVSLEPGEAWSWLMNVEAIVPCMPGAELVEIKDDRSFKGKISVRLGPVGLSFLCNAVFSHIDDQHHKATINADGADAKGRGAAKAQINFALQPCDKGSQVLITTNLELSGAVAQYGRGAGLIQNVANQIVSRFAENLEARISYARENQSSTGLAVSEQLSQGSVGDASPRPAPVPAIDATGNASAHLYTEGFKAGFSAGHAAGFKAALDIYGMAKTVPRTIGQQPSFPKAKPINGFSIFFSSLASTIAGWFSRKTR